MVNKFLLKTCDAAIQLCSLRESWIASLAHAMTLRERRAGKQQRAFSPP